MGDSRGCAAVTGFAAFTGFHPTDRGNYIRFPGVRLVEVAMFMRYRRRSRRWAPDTDRQDSGRLIRLVPRLHGEDATRGLLGRQRSDRRLTGTHHASPSAGLTAPTFKELFEALQIPAGAHAHSSQQIADSFGDTARLVVDSQDDSRPGI